MSNPNRPTGPGAGDASGSQHRRTRYETQRLIRRQRQLIEILAGDQTDIQELKERRPEGVDKLNVISVFEEGVAMSDSATVYDHITQPTFAYNDPDRGYGYSEYRNSFYPAWEFETEWDTADTIGASFNAPEGSMTHSDAWPGGDERQVQVGYDPTELEELGCVACWPCLGHTGTETTLVDIVGDYDCTATTANATGSQLVGETSTRADPNGYTIGDITGTGLASVLGNLGNTIAFWVNIDPTQSSSWSTQLNWSVQRNDGGTASVQVSQQGDSIGTLYPRWIADDINDPAVNNNTDGGFWVRNDTWTVPTNEWHFYTSTLGTDGIRLYWDATLQGTKTTAPKPADPNGFFRLINGQMESARGPTMIFDRALSDAEIQQLYWNTNPAANSRMLVQHESFDEYIKPVLFTDHDLNGGRIDMKVNGSPNSSPDGANTESIDFELTEDEFYELDWQQDHKYFRINFSLAPSADHAQTPVIRAFRFTTP